MKRGSYTPRPKRAARMRQLDAMSRHRTLTDRESRELERLLHADYCARLRCDQAIPRGVA